MTTATLTGCMMVWRESAWRPARSLSCCPRWRTERPQRVGHSCLAEQFDHLLTFVAEKTLFRSNTPLSKLLESTIRLLSQDFLIRSIGPTIARLALCSSTSGTILSSDNTPIQEELVKVSELVEACWADMYGEYPIPYSGHKEALTEVQPLEAVCQSMSPLPHVRCLSGGVG